MNPHLALRRMQVAWRCYVTKRWGWCPLCNSSPPDVHCPVCGGDTRYGPLLPAPTRLRWIQRYQAIDR